MRITHAVDAFAYPYGVGRLVRWSSKAESAQLAEASFVTFPKRRLRLEIGAGQIVEQQIEARVEQVAPTPVR
jgi:hypothetical protein